MTTAASRGVARAPGGRRPSGRTERCGSRGSGTIEILVASAAAFLVLAGCTRTMLAQHELWRLEETRTALREAARRVHDTIAREIRAAGFDPLPGGPFDGSADAVSVALAGRIELLADHGGPGTAGAPDGVADPASDERIGFRRGAAPRTVHQTTGNLVVPLVAGIAVPAGGLVFRYFDACGDELLPGAAGLDPASRAAIRSVRVRLVLVDPARRGRLETETVVSLRNRQELPCRV